MVPLKTSISAFRYLSAGFNEEFGFFSLSSFDVVGNLGLGASFDSSSISYSGDPPSGLVSCLLISAILSNILKTLAVWPNSTHSPNTLWITPEKCADRSLSTMYRSITITLVKFSEQALGSYKQFKRMCIKILTGPPLTKLTKPNRLCWLA